MMDRDEYVTMIKVVLGVIVAASIVPIAVSAILWAIGKR